MAVTAKFSADFSSFYDAIRKADLELHDLGEAAFNVQTKLNNMVDKFSGRRLIQDSIAMATALELAGGASKLTASELERVGAKADEAIEKMKRIGQDVPPGLQKVSDLARGAAEEASRLGDAGKTAGTSWEKFTQGFDIQNAISNPLAAAKTASLGFTQSLTGVALAGAAAVAGVVALGGVLFKMSVDAAAVGAELDDLSDATGLSVPALDRLRNASAVLGKDLTQLTDVVFKLEQRMGEGGEKFEAALGKIGISTEQLKQAGPDHYLELIAAGLDGLNDPAERAAAGAAIFGKGYKDVAAILKDLPAALELSKDITLWTPEQAANAEKFEMQLASLKVHAEAFGASLGRDLIPWVEKFIDVSKNAASNFIDAKFGLAIKAVKLLGEAWRFAAEGISTYRGEQLQSNAIAADSQRSLDAYNTSITKRSLSLKDGAQILGRTIDTEHDARMAIIDLTRANEIHAGVLKATGDAQKKAAKEAKEAADAAAKATEEFNKQMHAEEGVARAASENVNFLVKSLHGLGEALPKLKDFGQFELDAAKGADSVSELTKNLWGLGAALEKMPLLSFGQSLVAGLQDQLAKIPSVLAQAFTGGGGVAGAVQAAGTGLGAMVGEAFGKKLGGTLGKAMGPVGAIAGAELGKSTSGILSNTLSGAAIGTMILPGWGTAIGAGVGAIVGIAKKAFNDAEKKINPLREAFVQINGGLAQLNAHAHDAGVTLDAMLNAKNAEQYQKAIEDLNAAFKFQDDAMATLLATAQKYGFTLEELGPALQRQELGKQAEEIYQDFQVLTAGGLDHIAVLTRMAEGVNTYIQNAAAMGTEVPASMELMLQQMIDLGLLTDKDGNKIEDLAGSGVTFSTTMTAGFKSVVEAVEKLAAAISGKLGTAIANIPSDVTVGVHFNVDNPDLARFGEPIMMARGGRGVVNKPTVFVAGENGPEPFAFGDAVGGGGDTAGMLSQILDALRAQPRAFRDAAMGAAV